MRARTWSWAVFLVAVGVCALGDDAPKPTPAPVDPQEIRTLLSILDSPDEVERNAALHGLLAIGRPVLPYLEERLRLRAGDAWVDLLQGLAVLPEAPKPAPGVPSGPGDPPAAEASADPAEVAKYFEDKYATAARLKESGDYEKALSIAELCIRLEPRCARRNDFQKIKVECEERITEARLVKPMIVTRQKAYRARDKIDLTFRIEDATAGPVDVDLTGKLSGLARGVRSFLFGRITVTEYTPYGDMRSWTRDETWGLKEDAHLTPATPWTLPTTLDVSQDAKGAPLYRTYTIEAEMRPFLFRTPAGDIHGRRIVFPPPTVAVFPIDGDLDVLRGRGLELLSSAFDRVEDAGPTRANDVFLVCLLLEDRDKPKAVDLLMTALGHPRATELDKQLILSCLRQLTHLPLEMSEEAWLRWWKDQPANPKKR